MAHFADNPPKKNLDKIIEFLNAHYKDSDNFGCGKIIRNRHIDDVRMAGVVVDETPYTILIRNRWDARTSIINTRDRDTAESVIREHLVKTDGDGISHVFCDGEEIEYGIEIRWCQDDDDYTGPCFGP